MSQTKLIIAAGVAVGLIGTALYAQDAMVKPTASVTAEETAPNETESVLAAPDKIQQCLTEALNIVSLPDEVTTQEDGRDIRTYETGDITASIITNVNGYRADDPERETDQVDLFVRFEDRSEDPAIEIYRSAQVSFNKDAFIPHTPKNPTGAMYGHYNEIENGRNFTPTEKEALIEAWVNESITAMDKEFKSCMGFEVTDEEVPAPTFPEL